MRNANRKTLAFGLATALAAGAAVAQTVQIDNFAHSQPVVVRTEGAGEGLTGLVYAAQLAGTLDGASFLTYCLELPQAPLFGHAAPYTAGQHWDSFSAMSRAYTWIQDVLRPQNGVQAATAQAVLWEVLYETVGSFDLNSGYFRIGTDVALAPIDWRYIQDGTRSGMYLITRLENPTYQDFLSARPIPELDTYLMLLAGVAALVGVIQHKAYRKSVFDRKTP